MFKLLAKTWAAPVAQRALIPVARRCFASTTSGTDYDLVVVGGGPGGYVAAIKAAQLGLRTACVESRGSLGGTCLNVGCIPSKALLHSSHMYHEAQHTFSKHGIIANDVSFDFDGVLASKDKAVSGLTSGIEGLFKKNKVDYVKGFGSLGSANSVEVALNEGGSATLSAKNILIATGSEPTELPFMPFDEKKVVSSTGALALEKVPEHLVVVGGGYIGLEMGSVYARFGSKVTVVEFLDRIVPMMDKECGDTFNRLLKKQGLKFKLGTGVKSADTSGDGVVLTVENKKGKEEQIDCDVVLVSVGRRPFTGGLGIDALGISTDKMGRIDVDDQFRTAVPSIRAIGDCIAGPMLAHKAEEEGIAAVEWIAGRKGHVNYDVIPGVVYTQPEVASVGMTEEECKEKGVKYVVGKFPFMANSRARTNDDADGLVKFIADAETDRILGAHIVGSNAGEMIHECVLAMEYGASCEDIARTCHAHPTLSEATKEAAMAAYDKPIHF